MNSNRGYSQHKASGKLEAYVMRGGRKLYIGLYNTAREAEAAVKAAQKVLRTVCR